MADETTSRVDEVTAHIEAVEEKYGVESYQRIQTQCLKEIAISTAMLVDGATTEE